MSHSLTRVIVGVTVAVVTAGGCSDSDDGLPLGPGGILLLERDHSAHIQTEMIEYRPDQVASWWPQWVMIETDVTYTNPTDETRYLSYCGGQILGVQLQKRSSSGWVDVVVPDCPRVLVAPAVVPPGESYTGRVRIAGSLAPNQGPAFRAGSVPGLYRLKFFVYDDWEVSDPPEGWDPPDLDPNQPIYGGSSLDDLVSLPERVSNVFALRTD